MDRTGNHRPPEDAPVSLNGGLELANGGPECGRGLRRGWAQAFTLGGAAQGRIGLVQPRARRGAGRSGASVLARTAGGHMRQILKSLEGWIQRRSSQNFFHNSALLTHVKDVLFQLKLL